MGVCNKGGLVTPITSSTVRGFCNSQNSRTTSRPRSSRGARDARDIASRGPTRRPTRLSSSRFCMSICVPSVGIVETCGVLLKRYAATHRLTIIMKGVLTSRGYEGMSGRAIIGTTFVGSLLPFTGQLISNNAVTGVQTRVGGVLTDGWFFRLSSCSVNALTGQRVVCITKLSSESRGASSKDIRDSPRHSNTSTCQCKRSAFTNVYNR